MSGMEWGGVRWSGGVEWSGVECIGSVEWSGVEWGEVQWREESGERRIASGEEVVDWRGDEYQFEIKITDRNHTHKTHKQHTTHNT